MAVYLNNGVVFKFGSSASPTNNLSSIVSSATLTWKYDALEITSMGDLAHKYVQGLQSGQLDLEVFNDDASNKTLQLFNTAVGNTYYCSLQQSSAATSAANPLYSFTVFVDSITPVNGAVGDMSTQTISWQLNSVVTMTTS
jgi:hypothetical protein